MREASSTREGKGVKEEVRAISRLATLERLRDQARANHREAMLHSIEQMIQAELRVLHRLRDAHAGGASQTSNLTPWASGNSRE